MKRAIRVIWTVILVAAFVLTVPAASHAAVPDPPYCFLGTNNHCLTFDSLPSDPSQGGWTYFQGGSTPESSAFHLSPDNTSLIQTTVGTGFTGGVNPNYALFGAVNRTQPFALIVQAAITNYEGTERGGFFFDVRTASPNQEYAILFTPSEVIDPLGNAVAVDTTVFHTYILRAFPGHNYTLSIYNASGNFETSLTGPPSSTGGALDAVQFGDGNSLNANADVTITRLEYWQGNPMVMPTTGRLSQPFLRPRGPSKALRNPYYTQIDLLHPKPTIKEHSGVDLTASQPPCSLAAPVYAAAAGTVVDAGPANSGGTKVIIDHGNALSPSGKFVFTEYFHMCDIKVKAGIPVDTNTLLGYQSDLGASGHTHLHWDIRVSQTDIDPLLSPIAWRAVPYASPDFYTCAPLTYGDNPPPPVDGISVTQGQNYCFI